MGSGVRGEGVGMSWGGVLGGGRGRKDDYYSWFTGERGWMGSGVTAGGVGMCWAFVGGGQRALGGWRVRSAVFFVVVAMVITLFNTVLYAGSEITVDSEMRIINRF